MKRRLSQHDDLEALTVPQVAHLLHLCQPSVRGAINRGDLASVKIGRCRRVVRRDLEAFLRGLASSRPPAPAPAAPREPPGPATYGQPPGDPAGENVPF